MLLIYDDFFKKHYTGGFHPESPGRLESIKKCIDRNARISIDFRDNISFEVPLKAEQQHILKVHNNDYIKKVSALSSSGKISYLDADTIVSEHTYDCALLAAGACTSGIDYLLGKNNNNIEPKIISRKFFALIRPPGHHAFPSYGSGFCIFNNIAIAAKYARDNFSIKKTAIIDFDVHHGNGTQDIFYDDSSVFYVSLHQYPHYPGTGYWTESGKNSGEGFNLNIPLTAFAQEYDYIAAFTDVIIPVLLHYRPELILLSAGFDGHKNDNLSSVMLETQSYYKIMQLILFLGDACTCLAENKKPCNIGIVLEGGYDYESVSESTIEVIKACIENDKKSLLSGCLKEGRNKDRKSSKNEIIKDTLSGLKKNLLPAGKSGSKISWKNLETFKKLNNIFNISHRLFSVFFIVILCLLLLPFYSGCRKYDDKLDIAYFFKTAPEQSVIDFMNAIGNHDADYIYSNFLLESDSRNISREKFTREMSEILSKIESIQIDRIVYLGYDENMTKVVAEFRVLYVNGQEGDYKKYIYLIEENGKWKIVFDKTFI